jgi:succinate-acetate transporter protein
MDKVSKFLLTFVRGWMIYFGFTALTVLACLLCYKCADKEVAMFIAGSWTGALITVVGYYVRDRAGQTGVEPK